MTEYKAHQLKHPKPPTNIVLSNSIQNTNLNNHINKIMQLADELSDGKVTLKNKVKQSSGNTLTLLIKTVSNEIKNNESAHQSWIKQIRSVEFKKDQVLLKGVSKLEVYMLDISSHRFMHCSDFQIESTLRFLSNIGDIQLIIQSMLQRYKKFGAHAKLIENDINMALAKLDLLNQQIDRSYSVAEKLLRHKASQLKAEISQLIQNDLKNASTELLATNKPIKLNIRTIQRIALYLRDNKELSAQTKNIGHYCSRYYSKILIKKTINLNLPSFINHTFEGSDKSMLIHFIRTNIDEKQEDIIDVILMGEWAFEKHCVWISALFKELNFSHIKIDLLIKSDDKSSIKKKVFLIKDHANDDKLHLLYDEKTTLTHYRNLGMKKLFETLKGM